MHACLFSFHVIHSFAAQYKRVGYYTNWAQYRPDPMKFFPENIDVSLADYYNFAFAFVENCRLVPYEWNDEEMCERPLTFKMYN